MRILVTGGAGFIGSNFVDFALEHGADVCALDNLETGFESFLEKAQLHPKFFLIEADIRQLETLTKIFKDFKPEWIVHFAANADVRFGTDQPRKDLDYNTIGTWNVLEAARLAKCKKVLFSSTGSVYGEPSVFPTPEDCPFPEQTSLYASSKLAGEALISSYCHGYGFTGLVFRFVSILGPRYTHGHVFDFVKALQKHPDHMRVLGNGKQCKSYLHVSDLMEGLWTGIDHAEEGFQLFNIGHDDALIVDQSIDYITERMNLEPRRDYAGGERGWIGDSPKIHLDTSKLKNLGWSAKRSLKDSVQDTVDYLLSHPELLEARD